MSVMLVSGLKKEKENHYTLNRGKAVLTTGSTSESCLRLVTALAAEQSDEWVSGKRYLNMEELVDNEAESGIPARELIAVN